MSRGDVRQGSSQRYERIHVGGAARGNVAANGHSQEWLCYCVLLVAQRYERIDADGAARGNVTSEQRDAD
jgi:hypothetical protein